MNGLNDIALLTADDDDLILLEEDDFLTDPIWRGGEEVETI